MDYPYERMTIAGIRSAQSVDIGLAREFNCRIKLLGMARMANGLLEAGVYPAMVNRASSLLARVGGAVQVAVVGYGRGGHAESLGPGDEIREADRAVQQAVFGMAVQMDEVGHTLNYSTIL
jgi:homoserine dehydrogenase